MESAAATFHRRFSPEAVTTLHARQILISRWLDNGNLVPAQALLDEVQPIYERLLAEAEPQEGHPAGSLQRFRRAAEAAGTRGLVFPATPLHLLLHEGRVALAQGRPEAALVHFTEAQRQLRAAPDSELCGGLMAQAVHQMGRAHLARGDAESARPLLEQASALTARWHGPASVQHTAAKSQLALLRPR